MSLDDDRLFDAGPELELERKSADVRRRERAELAIAVGRHPLGQPLREPAGETCGSCVHAEGFRYRRRTYWKCPTVGGLTHGPGTDLRLKWPACNRWEPRPEELEA